MHVEDIQREMESVRSSLRSDVRSLARQARNSTDWRHYVRHYPFACLCAVAVAGYLLVPRRNRGKQPAERDATASAALSGSMAGLAAGIKSMALRTLAKAAVQHGIELLNRRKFAATAAEESPDVPRADAPSVNAEPW
ncbi:MAG: hypothetical protein HY290_30865 [Planctomycetia bacterium]|nr:hypothetical protein [Planctomycetia bacterium]